MKTNQMMEVNLGKFGVVKIGHKTEMGNLNQVLEIGNEIRESKGLKPKSLHTYLRSRNTWELILKVYNEKVVKGNDIHKKEFGQLPKNSESVCEISQKVLYQETLDNLPMDLQGRIKYSEIAKTKIFDDVFKIQNRGKLENRGVWANLFIMLDLAQWLDVDLRYEIYRVFIEERILIHRDNGGEEFKKINSLIDTLPDRIKKANKRNLPNSKSNKGAYINIAKMINAKVNSIFKKGWNDKDKEVKQQQMREDILKFLSNAIEHKFITSYNQLKATIENYNF